jgi:hypothetical protein
MKSKTKKKTTEKMTRVPLFIPTADVATLRERLVTNGTSIAWQIRRVHHVPFFSTRAEIIVGA